MHRFARPVSVVIAAAVLALPAVSTAAPNAKPSGVTITSASCTVYAAGGWNIAFTWTQKNRKTLTPTDWQLYDPSVLNGQAASISVADRTAMSVDNTYPTGAPGGSVTDARQLTLFTYVNGVETDLATTTLTCSQG
jgi:hypothetical protein